MVNWNKHQPFLDWLNECPVVWKLLKNEDDNVEYRFLLIEEKEED